MRYATLFCILGLLCGPAHAQDFFVEQSAPAHGDTDVPLADTVAFSFNKQVAISTDFNTEFVYRPSDSLSFDKVELCLTFLGVCDAGDDIPRHVRYEVDHQSNTDYTWLVYGVQTVDGDSMSEPYTLRYTTAPDIGQGEVNGSVAAPVPLTASSVAAHKSMPRTSGIRASLRELAEGLERSELGHLVFNRPDSSTAESDPSTAPSDRPGTHFKTVGRKAASEGPYTQILLVDEFSINKDAWSVRAGDALIGSSGGYSLDFVRSGSYVPIAVRYTDGTSTEIDALGFHDPDGDGAPNVVEVDGGTLTNIEVQLFEFPRTTARAEDNLPVAIDSADQYASDQELRWIEAETGIDPSGTAFEWTYRFYSPSTNLETEVTINPLEATVDTSTTRAGFVTEMDPIPDGFVDSDAALDTALANGGQEFIDQFPPRNRVTLVAGGNLFWTDPPDATAEFWRVRFIGVSGSVQTFERFVSMRSGDILSEELPYPSQVEVDIRRTFGDASGPGDYRLVALPGRVDTSLAQAFPGEAGAEWQAYWDNGSAESPFVRYDGSETFDFQPGRGFWVTSRQDWSFSDSLRTVPLGAGQAAAVPLNGDSTWTIVSNPLDRAAAWQSVRAGTNISAPLWRFDGSEGFVRADTMRSAASGEAYYFFNAAELDSLSVPYPATGSKAVPKSALASSPADRSATAPLALSAAPAGEGKLPSTVHVGLLEGSSRSEESGRSALAPPGRFEPVSLRIVGQDGARPEREDERSARARHYMVRTRPVGSDGGHTFQLRLSARTEGPVQLSASGLEALEGRAASLIVPSTGKSYDLRPGRTVEIEPQGETTRLRLAVGTSQYIGEEARSALPEEIRLTSYPNPTRERATVEYTLPEAQEVTLEVYDVLGRRVATLEEGKKSAGQHEASLQARKLPSGVYFGRLKAGGKTRTQKITVVR